MLWVIIPAGIALLAVVAGKGGSSRPAQSHGMEPAKDRGVDFAIGGRPIWPIHPSSRHASKYTVSYKDAAGSWHGRAARAFKADRGSRHHAGMDLFANAGDVIVAPEAGTVVRRQTFYKGTGAMVLELDSGLAVVLGETAMGGAGEFGITTGTRVQRGQPLTRVGLSNDGSHMLHLETYRSGTTTNSRWYKGDAAPPNLLDPTEWLLTAKANSLAIA